MNNLIEDIEKALENTRKLYEQVYENTIVRNYYHGIIVAYEGILKSLEDENIITAPKQIKLSEIVSRLNDCDKSNKFKVIIQVGETTVVENTEFKKEYFYIKNNKMFDLSEYMVRDEYKFLYALWIAGTIIEDDLGKSDDRI